MNSYCVVSDVRRTHVDTDVLVDRSMRSIGIDDRRRRQRPTKDGNRPLKTLKIVLSGRLPSFNRRPIVDRVEAKRSTIDQAFVDLNRPFYSSKRASLLEKVFSCSRKNIFLGFCHRKIYFFFLFYFF